MLGKIDIADLLPPPIAEAYRTGRIMDTSVAAWTAKYEAAPEATAAELGNLAPGLPEQRERIRPAEAEFSVEGAYEALFGQRPPGASAPPSPSASPSPAPSPAVVTPTSERAFSDADIAVAVDALFPHGVGTGTLEG